MTTLIETPVVGLEDLQRAAFYVFFENFNATLQAVSDYWTQRDLDFDTHTGRTTAPTVLEQIKNDNFHEGHKPSLIRSPPEGYPNLSVMALRADPSSETDRFDQMDSWSDSLMIEILVKATDEDAVNRRIQRTTEAAMICLRRNPTLGSSVYGLENTPTVMISDVFALKSDAGSGGYGERFIWQGSQISWRVRKDSTSPGPNASIFQHSASTDYSQFIDQG